MPQMAPMWWLTIMIISTLILLMLMTMNYFTQTKNNKVKLNKSLNNDFKYMNWKW